MPLPPSLENLIRQFASLPGVGRKSARRLAFHVMGLTPEAVNEFARSLEDAKQRIHPCSVCHQYTEMDPCPICSDPKRDHSRICVVERSSDIDSLEAGGVYQGLYHVLGGVLSPLDGIGPDQLHLPLLVERVRKNVSEVILALGTSPEADATALLIDRMLGPLPARRTRLARGIPVGSDLEFVDELTMLRAFEGRVQL